MSRTIAAIVLFAAGLGIGLWMGFDPEARAAVESNWEEARESVAQAGADVGVDAGASEPAGEAAESEKSISGNESSPLDPIADVSEDLWRSTQKWWFSLLARLDLSP